MKTRIISKHQVQWDGRTVWVTARDATTVGRFSPFGIDLHQPHHVQLATGIACLACTHHEPGESDWATFCSGLREHYGVELPDACRPQWLRPERVAS